MESLVEIWGDYGRGAELEEGTRVGSGMLLSLEDGGDVETAYSTPLSDVHESLFALNGKVNIALSHLSLQSQRTGCGGRRLTNLEIS